MPKALIWLSAYVGVCAQTLTGRKQLILFIFHRDSTTCQVHMPYVVAYGVPDVTGQPCPCAIFLHRSAIEFRCHAIAKIYAIDRRRVRITPGADVGRAQTEHRGWLAQSQNIVGNQILQLATVLSLGWQGRPRLLYLYCYYLYCYVSL